MSAEPFLVEGASALSAGDPRRAEQLLKEAAARDPRMPAARFLLADLYLQQGRTGEGLQQVAALIRRLPKATAPLSLSLAQFARQPGAAPHVRAILARNPALRRNVLSMLALDADNAALVLELAGREPRSSEVTDWQVRLLSALVARGDYAEAHRLWARFAGIQPGQEPMLFNPGFERMSAPPPFNWTLAGGASGVAEPALGGGLHLLYYGREDTVLARQILVLRPGRYRLRYDSSGSGTNLSWTVTCLPANRVIASERSGGEGLAFAVPPDGCPAQELQLRGSAAEVPSTTEVTIRNLRLVREGGR